MFGRSTKKRYLHWREINCGLNSRIFGTLTKGDILDGARNLGLLRGKTIVAESETEMELLMDHCNYDLRRRDKRNAVERFAQSNVPLSEEERTVLEHMCNVRFRLLGVVDKPRGIAFDVIDAFRQEQIKLIDIGLSRSMTHGFLMACHTVPTGIEDCWATSGVGLPIGEPEIDEVLDEVCSIIPANTESLSHLTPAEWSSVARVVFRTALQFGRGEDVTFLDPRHPHQGALRRSVAPREELANF